MSLHRLIARAVPSMVASRIVTRPILFRSFASHSAPIPSAPVKFTTNLAGLDVVPNGREVFIGLQKEILASIQTYNKQLGFEPKCNEFSRRFAEHRLKIAEEEDDVAFIEKRLWSGQIEELIEQAEDELDTIVLMNEDVKPWEKPAEAHQAQFDSFATQGFGQHPDAFASRKPVPITPEEQAQVDEFWKSIDEEIKQDQEREAAERQARKAKKGQQ